MSSETIDSIASDPPAKNMLSLIMFEPSSTLSAQARLSLATNTSESKWRANRCNVSKRSSRRHSSDETAELVVSVVFRGVRFKEQFARDICFYFFPHSDVRLFSSSLRFAMAMESQVSHADGEIV